MPATSLVTSAHRTIWPLIVLLSCACAVAPPPPLLVASPPHHEWLEEADALSKAGCYRCLLEARASYEDLVDTAADQVRVAAGLFQTSLLLSMREREMGLVGRGGFDRVEELASDPAAPTHWAMFVNIARTTAWQSVGVPKSLLDENTVERGRLDRERETWSEFLRPLVRADSLAAYLFLGVNCTDAWLADQPATLLDDLAGHDDALYVRYARARCTRTLAEESLIETLEPRFTEMKFFLAQIALRDGAVGLAEFQLSETQADWPDWPAPVLGLADLALAAEDHQASLGLYDRMLRLVPDQRDALLGKAKALSYLNRPEDALPLLDRLAVLGQWYLGDTYYWRAWNRFSLDSIELARADIDEARRHREDVEVLTLAGQIAIEQGRLDEARNDLETALRATDRACDAALHLGRVHVAQTRWPETAVTFDRAARCFTTAAEEASAELERIRRDPGMTEDRRGRVVAQYASRVGITQRLVALSAFNAALGYTNADALNDAETQARRASGHADFAGRANALLNRIRTRRAAESTPEMSPGREASPPPRD